MGPAARVSLGLLGLAGAALALIYLNRAFLDLPLYASAEGGHLIHALFGKPMSLRPELLPQVQALQDTSFSLIIRATTYATQSLLPWLRMLGALAYFGGLIAAYLTLERSLERRRAAVWLLIALAYPYYRFAFSALPDGWFVGVLGLIILSTSHLFMARPVVHAALAGALSGVLVLLKPQGLAVVAAFLVLALIDLGLGRRDVRVWLGRTAAFLAAFLAGANLIQLLANQPIVAPFSFFLGRGFDALLAGQLTAQDWIVAARALVVMVAASMVLAGLPVLTGLLRVEMRWGWCRGRMRFTLEPQEATFLLTLLTLVGTLLITATLAMTDIAGGPNRTWGRHFEAMIPLLWLTAGSFMGEFDRAAGRWWRLAMAIAPLIGLAGLAACMFDGARPQHWEAAALTAFSPDEPVYAAIAAATIFAAGAAMAFTAWPAWRIWLAAFVAIAGLATGLDVRWERAGALARDSLSAELAAADRIVASRPGGVAMMSQDNGTARLAFWRLHGRPQAVLANPDPQTLAGVDTLVSLGTQAPGPEWRALYSGRHLTVFGRSSTISQPPRSSLDSGGAIGSGPGSG